MSDKYGYMCKIDWDYEVGSALGGNIVYPSIKDLKKNHSTVGCGIVKVKVTLEEVIDETNFHLPGATISMQEAIELEKEKKV